eukprot:1158209-Pelagomonas_calceolata.AAC.15
MGAVEHSNPYSITAGVCTSSRGVVQREGRNMRGHDAAWLRTRTALERMEAHAAVTLAAVAMHRAGPVGLQPPRRMTEPGKLQVSVKGHDQGSKGDWAKRTEGTITRAPWVTELGRPRDRMHSTTALCKKTVQATHSATALSDETANHALSNSLMHRV